MMSCDCHVTAHNVDSGLEHLKTLFFYVQQKFIINNRNIFPLCVVCVKITSNDQFI